MKKTLLTIFSLTILIGVIALCLNMTLGQNTVTFIKKEIVYYNTTNHFYIWKFDFWHYIQNLQLSVTDLSILVFNLPTRQWENNMDWNALGNNLLVILDYLIVVINILLYPIKIGAYLLRNIMAVIGINQDINAENNGLAWLTYFINNILANFTIPYI